MSEVTFGPQAVSTQKHRQTGLQRRLRALLFGAVSSSALIATPQLASAQIVGNPTPPNYLASGQLTTPQHVTANNANITTEAGFSIVTDTDNALTVVGNGALVYTDTNSSSLITNASWGRGLFVDGAGDYDSTPGSVTITTNGEVRGGAAGVYAISRGQGDITITTTGEVSATAANGVGIDVQNGIESGDITVNAATVEGGDTGIKANNKGTGNISITATGAVEGTAGVGIHAVNAASTHDLTINAASVTGATYGIIAINNGGVDADDPDAISAQADTIVRATGKVTSTTEDAIYVQNAASANNLTVEAKDVSGGIAGIRATNNGTGHTSVTAEGLVDGGSGSGISATNSNSSKNLTVNAVDVSGGSNGISAVNNGTGDTSVTATGTVTGASAQGIVVFNGQNANNLTVAAGEVTGGIYGILVDNSGTGDTSVSATGPVKGESYVGIQLTNGASAHDLTINAASVTGSIYGIYAINNGGVDADDPDFISAQANTFVKATGQVTSTSNDAIYVLNAASANNLTVEAKDVSGGSSGIRATNNGTGNTSVTAEGLVEGGSGSGFTLINSNTSKNLTVNAVDVSGGSNGIYAENNGTGDTSITATGTVTGASAQGIVVFNGQNANNLTVAAGEVTGGVYGIAVDNSGTGDTSVSATGLVKGESYTGIQLTNGASAHDLTINAASVTGSTYGIYAINNGGADADDADAISAQADTFVKATGKVTSTSNDAISILNEATANHLTVETQDVSGGLSGIRATNNGTGNTSVTAEGLVEGGSGSGITALSYNSSKNLTVNAVDVSGGSNGIYAANNGIGDTSITATGTVTGALAHGIAGLNGQNANNLTVTAGEVTGGAHGIIVVNSGTGHTNVSATGLVKGESYTGIQLTNSATTNGMTVNVQDVEGNTYGIEALNSGKGDTSITARDVTAKVEDGIGIDVLNAASAHDLTINAASVTASKYGIYAVNNGGVDVDDSDSISAQADTRVTVTGTVTATGTTSTGIHAMNSSSGNDVIVEAATVTGGERGIVANNLGAGDISVTATGTVTGTGVYGILALNNAAAKDIAVQTAAVTGGLIGIYARNEGSGDTNVTATGTLTGTAAGVLVDNWANTGNLTLNTATVIGNSYGIYAINKGTGATSVTATGNVTANLETGEAIFVSNEETAGTMVINALGASGGKTGIVATQNGTGKTTITLGGVVEGAETGMNVFASNGQAIEINNNGTVRNSGLNPTALAIFSEEGAVTLNNNNLLHGTVQLSDDGNTINNVGTWNVAGGTSQLGDGSNLIDNKASGTILAANATGPVATIFNGVGSFIHAGDIVLQNQEAGGQTAYVGDVVIFTNGGNGNFQSNGGRVLLDTDFVAGTSDVLVVDNVTVGSGPTRVYINPVGLVKPTSEQGINVVEVGGTSADDAFVLGNSVGDGLYAFELGRGLRGNNNQSWYLRNSGMIRGEVPMAGALSVLAGRTSLATLSSMHERQREGDNSGDNYASLSGTRLVSRSSTVTLPEADRTASKGVWGRVFGQNNNFSSNGGINAGYDTKLWGAQAGIDLLAKGTQETGRTYAGIYLGHASSSGDGLRGNTRLGTLKVDATTLGAYYTSISGNGFYWDAVAQYSRISDAKMKYMGETTDTEGSSYLASLEAGKQFNRQSKYVTEVQGQLLYQKTSIDNMTLPDSTRFDVGSQSGFTGRVGVRLARNPHQGATFQPWVSANIWRTFNQDVCISSLGESVSTPAGGTTGEVQLGFSLAPHRANGWSAYFSGGYQFDVSGSEYSGWKGSVGVRKSW